MTGPGVDRLVVFQETALFPWMTTYDNIMYGPRARHEDTSEMREFAISSSEGWPCGVPEEISFAALWRHAAARRIGAFND